MTKMGFANFTKERVFFLLFFCAFSTRPYFGFKTETYAKDKVHSSLHNLHISYLKVAIEGKNGIMKISFFKDDLTLALKSFNSEFTALDSSATLDSLFSDYIKNRLEITIAEKPVKLDLVSSGEEGDMWWFQIEFVSSVTIKEFEIKNSCLMEVYEDQKNIIQIMHFPKEKTYSYYCIAGSNRYKVNLE